MVSHLGQPQHYNRLISVDLQPLVTEQRTTTLSKKEHYKIAKHGVLSTLKSCIVSVTH